VNMLMFVMFRYKNYRIEIYMQIEHLNLR
jgi:hypothetical protein